MRVFVSNQSRVPGRRFSSRTEFELRVVEIPWLAQPLSATAAPRPKVRCNISRREMGAEAGADFLDGRLMGVTLIWEIPGAIPKLLRLEADLRRIRP